MAAAQLQKPSQVPIRTAERTVKIASATQGKDSDSGLGLERLDFCITGERERIVPERVRRQQKMLEEQKKRMETVQ